jgi:glycosyltransferase involved in cell wall biosynthesis
MKLYYLANIRMPTEKAHGLQIMQMCEAFAQAGAEVTLIVPNRYNTSEMNKIADVWAYYGVEKIFNIERLACIDLFPLGKGTEKLAFYIQTLTYTFMIALTMLFRRADVYYSRDLLTLFALSLLKPRRTLAYEAHQMFNASWSRSLQQQVVRRSGTVVAVTARLMDDLKARGAKHSIVAHDGFQNKRFSNLPDRSAARAQLQLPGDSFIVGYIGRLHTMNMSKGIDKLIDAIVQSARPISLCLVGGPDDMANTLRQRWLDCGLPAERFLAQGHVEPALVPVYLAAFDGCAMPFPDTEHFRYYMSPLKLFEYMAAGRAIISSDLLSVAEVLQDGVNGLLVPPDDVSALTGALQRLYDDPALRTRLADQAQRDAQHYSWRGRADHILNAVQGSH